MSPKYKVGDLLFYKDQWGIMFFHILSIDIQRQVYHTSVIRNDIHPIEVPYPFKMLHNDDKIRLATKAERLFYKCK